MVFNKLNTFINVREIARAYTGAQRTSYDFDHHDPDYGLTEDEMAESEENA